MDSSWKARFSLAVSAGRWSCGWGMSAVDARAGGTSGSAWLSKGSNGRLRPSVTIANARTPVTAAADHAGQRCRRAARIAASAPAAASRARASEVKVAMRPGVRIPFQPGRASKRTRYGQSRPPSSRKPSESTTNATAATPSQIRQRLLRLLDQSPAIARIRITAPGKRVFSCQVVR